MSSIVFAVQSTPILTSSLTYDFSELGDGHYWVSSELLMDIPLRLIGDEHNPSNVVVEVSGSIVWRAQSGFVEGVTFRRPKLSSDDSESIELLSVVGSGSVDIVQSVFDNQGSQANVVVARGIGRKGKWESCLFQNGGRGIALQEKAHLEIHKVRILSSLSFVQCKRYCILLTFACSALSRII